MLHEEIQLASAAILSGDSVAVLASVGRVAPMLEREDLTRLPSPTQTASIRLLAVFAAARARLAALSLRARAGRAQRPWLASEALALLGALADPANRRVLLERAIGEAQRRGGARRTFPWLAEAGDAGADSVPDRGGCLALPVEPSEYRFDCQLVRFESAWRHGRWSDVFVAFRALDRALSDALPVAQRLRAALAVLPFLKIVGDWQRYQRWHTEATAAARRLHEPGLVTALTIELAAGLRIAGRRHESERVLDEIDPAGDDGVTVRLRVERARLAAAVGSVREARRLMREAVEVARQTGEASRATAALAALDVDPGDLSSEDRRWIESLSPPDPISVPLWHELLDARFAEADGHWRTASRHYDRAWALARPVGQGSVEERVGGALLQRRISERRAAADLAAGHATRALEAIEAARSGRRPGDGSWRHLAGHAGAGDLVLAFAQVDGGLWGWRIDGHAVTARLLAVDAERVWDLARIWTGAVSGSASRRSWERIGTRLASLLLAPVIDAGWADGKSRLLAASAPGLEEVPLDVLAELTPGGAALVRRGVATADSLAALDGAWHRRRPEGKAVVFVPRTGTAALAEARIVGSTLGGRVYLGDDATKARFRDASAGAAIVHFGGHSEAPGPLLESGGLTLRPLAAAGILRYREIAGLRLDGATVVLLGCDTAGGTPSAALSAASGLASSLTDAFLRAGSRAVIGNLWTIDDPSARDIAMEFYAAGGPVAGPAALVVTKRRLRARYPAQPGRWAGLVWRGAPPG